MSTNDRTAALRNRRAQNTAPAPRQEAATGRPADLVITADMIPDPLPVESTGDLTPSERHDLGVCERAVDNLATARWRAGKALQSIRDRKLYRHTHPTFDAYVNERWEMSERAAYQTIEEWPLAQLLQQTLGRPGTPSHARALLPVAHRFGLAAAVDLYQQLGPRAAADGLRLTAALTSRVVDAVLAQTDAKADTPQFQEAARQLMTADTLPALEPAHPPAPRPPTSTTPPREETSASAPGDRSVEQATADGGEPDPQNFAEHHEPATAVGVVVKADAEVPGYLPNSVTPTEVLAYLRSILRRAHDIEAAINALVAVDMFHEGEAQDLREEIYRTLLRAAAPYRPFDPTRRTS